MTFDWKRLRHDSIYRAALTSEVRVNKLLREEGKLICKTNLLALCYVLGWTKIDPVEHREAIEFFVPKQLDKPVERQYEGRLRRGTLLYPRGAYKSTLNMADSVQWIICFPLTVAILILCANLKLAQAFVNTVASFFIRNLNDEPTLFQALFPELLITPRQASNGEFTANQRQTSPQIMEPAIWGNSIDAGLSGWHPNVLKPDDIVNNRNSRTETMLGEVTSKYKLNRKILPSYGIEDKMGTRYGANDVFGDEISTTRPGSYRFVVKPAMKLKDGGRLDATGFPSKEDVILLFPKTLPYEYLREEYESDYPTFMSQLMNDPYGANEVVFAQEEMLMAMKRAVDMPMDGRPHIHWRLPCKSRGWRNAAAAVGMEDRGRMWIVETKHGNFNTSALARNVVELARKYGTHNLSIEQTPGSSFIDPVIRNYAYTTGWHINLNWVEFEVDENMRDQRIKAMQADIASTRLLFNGEINNRKLFDQFTQYGMIDDFSLPDVVSRAVGNLPAAIAAEDEDSADSLAWEMMKQRDHYNMIHGLGAYADYEPAPEASGEEDAGWEPEPNEFGLEEIMPGLRG
jgi:hypothetical protein